MKTPLLYSLGTTVIYHEGNATLDTANIPS